MPRQNERQPYDLEAERQVIGSVIMEPSYLGQVDLDPGDFYHSEHRRLFEVILNVKQRGDEVSQELVRRELKNEQEEWALTRATSETLPLDCVAEAAKVKELSRRRRLVSSVDKALRAFQKDNLTSTEFVDRIRLALDSVSLPTRTSRMITITNVRIVQTERPTYKLTVSPVNGSSPTEVELSSAELDKPSSFRRHIREKLRVNPLLPKQYDEFIHRIVQQAEVESEQEDASSGETVCYWIREWFASAGEAEEVEDLNQGYVRREGARWFTAERLLRYLQDHARIKMDRSDLMRVISSRGGRKSKPVSVGGKKVRLWGLDETFFEDQEPVTDEQLGMAENEDVPCLEETE